MQPSFHKAPETARLQKLKSDLGMPSGNAKLHPLAAGQLLQSYYERQDSSKSSTQPGPAGLAHNANLLDMLAAAATACKEVDATAADPPPSPSEQHPTAPHVRINLAHAAMEPSVLIKVHPESHSSGLSDSPMPSIDATEVAKAAMQRRSCSPPKSKAALKSVKDGGVHKVSAFTKQHAYKSDNYQTGSTPPPTPLTPQTQQLAPNEALAMLTRAILRESAASQLSSILAKAEEYQRQQQLQQFMQQAASVYHQQMPVPAAAAAEVQQPSAASLAEAAYQSPAMASAGLLVSPPLAPTMHSISLPTAKYLIYLYAKSLGWRVVGDLQLVPR